MLKKTVMLLMSAAFIAFSGCQNENKINSKTPVSTQQAAEKISGEIIFTDSAGRTVTVSEPRKAYQDILASNPA